MFLEQITVTRTVQIRQYEPLLMSATATVDAQESPLEAFRALRELVMAALYEAQHPPTTPPATGQGDDLDAGF